MVQNIVEPRQTCRSSPTVLLDGRRGGAPDGDGFSSGARVACPARSVGKGAITVSARKLPRLSRSCDGGSLPARPGHASVSLKCGTASYKLVGMAPDDFPPVVPSAQAAWDSTSRRKPCARCWRDQFRDLARRDALRANGVLFALTGKDARLVATDGHRLALASRTGGQRRRRGDGIVRAKAVLEIQRCWLRFEEVQIALTENQFLLRMPEFS